MFLIGAIQLVITSHISFRRIYIVRVLASLILAAAILFGATNAEAAPDARLCAAKKNVAAGIFFKCMAKAEAKFDINQSVGDRIRAKRRCVERLEKFYVRADSRFGANCPTSADASIMEDDLAEISNKVSQWLRTNEGDGPVAPDIVCGPNTVLDTVSRTCTGAPVVPPDTCGNGEIEVGEECDFQNLGALTCSDYEYDRGNLECSEGCVVDTSGCYNDDNPTGNQRFEVLDNGTVLDRQLHVYWEGKWDPARINVSNRDLKFTKPAIDSFFLPSLNGQIGPFSTPFAGCNTWRLPRAEELISMAGTGFNRWQCSSIPLPHELCRDNTRLWYWSSTAVGDSGDFVGIAIPSGETKILTAGSDERAIAVCDITD
jgi:hypothetical protein